MMRTLLFKYVTLSLLMATFTASASNNGGGMKGKYTKEKTIKKEFKKRMAIILSTDS